MSPEHKLHVATNALPDGGAEDRPPTKPEDIAYPPGLRDVEDTIRELRPKWALSGNCAQFGIGLSGGGIRSATFCLGVFQALAKRRLLGEIDYLSSVSGGSYFASFYGRLFSRQDIKGLDEIEKILSPDERTRLGFPEAEAWKRGIFNWMRENGRYLAPKGGGDLLIGLAVMLRNWLTVQAIMASLILALLLVAQMLRLFGEDVFFDSRRSAMPAVSSGIIWWSPYLFLAALMWLSLVMPSGWSYWMLPQGEQSTGARKNLVISIWPVVASACASAAAVLVALQIDGYERYVLFGIAAGPILALPLCWWAQSKFSSQTSEALSDDDRLYLSEGARNLLSATLRTALVLTVVMLAFGLINSMGQTLYAYRFSGRHHLLAGLGGLYGISGLFAPFAQWAASIVMPKTKGRHVTIPVSMLAGVGAAVVILPVLIALDGLSHAIAYDFARPIDAPHSLMGSPKPANCGTSLDPCNPASQCVSKLKNGIVAKAIVLV